MNVDAPAAGAAAVGGTAPGETLGNANPGNGVAHHGRGAGSPFRGSSSRRWQRLVGVSAAARALESMIARAATVDSNVLLTGETGCGKEEIARALHAAGSRASRPFVAINCGAMAPTLIESQLFGHEKGSFTGAFGSSRGVFRSAEGGMVFLDEIGEMPLDLQPRLLRALQEREVTPLGSTESFHFDVQVVVATNRNLEIEVAEGRFREDLFYRINTIEIEVPSLRERSDDIPLFIEHFCQHFAEKFETVAWDPDPATMARLLKYHWPGNVRQLAQTIERAYALGSVPPLPGEDAPPLPAKATTAEELERPLPVLNLDALKLIAVRQALALTNGHKGKAANLLGVHLNTMTRLVEEAMPSASQRRRGRKPAGAGGVADENGALSSDDIGHATPKKPR
jgi:DNA-binding NtrC family response regulator